MAEAQASPEGNIVTRCLICDAPTTPDARFDGCCDGCVGGLVRDALFLRDGTPDVVRARVALFQDAQCPTLAQAAMGVVPFEVRPTRAELERLTDG